jgi:hypothetical protein
VQRDLSNHHPVHARDFDTWLEIQASLPKRFRSSVRPLGLAKPHQGRSREPPLQRLVRFLSAVRSIGPAPGSS